MRVHKDEPVTVYPECEFSPLASGVAIVLLLLLLLSSPSEVSLRLTRHLLFQIINYSKFLISAHGGVVVRALR